MKTQYDYYKEAHDQVMAEIGYKGGTVNYKLEETTPNAHFKYLIRIGRMLEFDQARKWLTQTYGLAEQIDRDTLHNPHWGFEIRLGGCTIYLRGDEELSWFKIKHGDPI